MNRRSPALLLSAVLLIAPTLGAQEHAAGHDHAAMARDTGYAAMQERGRTAMGVDQYTSAHRFDDATDGGRIVLRRGAADTAGATVIRRHLATVAAEFARGNFAVPGFVHATAVPGTEVMTARRAAIRYEVRQLPGGGEILIRTADPAAVAAIHRFLAFQRSEHRAPGAEL